MKRFVFSCKGSDLTAEILIDGTTLLSRGQDQFQLTTAEFHAIREARVAWNARRPYVCTNCNREFTVENAKRRRLKFCGPACKVEHSMKKMQAELERLKQGDNT